MSCYAGVCREAGAMLAHWLPFCAADAGPAFLSSCASKVRLHSESTSFNFSAAEIDCDSHASLIEFLIVCVCMPGDGKNVLDSLSLSLVARREGEQRRPSI